MLRVFISIAIVFMLFNGLSRARLTINNGTYVEESFPTGQYYWQGDDWTSPFASVTAVLADSSNENLEGKIVFQQSIGLNIWLDEMKRIQQAGAVAILYGTRSLVPGQYGCALTAAESTGQITIPVAEVSQTDLESLLSEILNGAVVEATLTSEGNEWNFLGGIAVIIVFRVIFTCCASGLIGYALYKMIMFIRFRGPQFNVSQVCLALEIIGNLWRIVYFAVDPFGCFGVFGNAMSFFTTISFPYEVGTFILITFYWYEVMTVADIKVYPFLHRLQPYFFAFTIGLILVILLVTVLGYVLALSITTPLIIIYLIVSLAFLIFYIVTLVKIMQRIKFSTNLRKSTADTVKKVNKKIVLNGIVRVTSLIPIIVFIAPQIATVPVPQFIASVFIYVMIMLDSWARIYLFTEPTSKKKSDKGTKLAKNSSTTQQNTTSPRVSSVDVANVGDNTTAETA
jgi:hypothetical protein